MFRCLGFRVLFKIVLVGSYMTDFLWGLEKGSFGFRVYTMVF